ncbi:MAG: YggS family pyridoxal phosphate-dependent enzyme [Gammaproteobacteria bacterium]
MADCSERLKVVEERLQFAARKAGRDPRRITLIAVSKTQPKARVAELLSAGHRQFGESTLQDAMSKIPHFASSEAVWHFVGHLQSNKAKLVSEHFSWVHSVDTLKLAARISAAAVQVDRQVNILLQVNIAKDPAKFGVSPDEVPAVAEHLLEAELPGVVLKGLMAIGPQGADPPGLQRAFARMRRLQESCAQKFGPEWFAELSIGMSGDFEVAVAEGATMVRVGTAIFGAREKINN